MRIAIDMDEVMADAVKKIRQQYLKEFHVWLSEEALAGKRFQEAVPMAHALEIKKWLHRHGFFRDFEVMKGCQSVIKTWVNDGHEVFVTTAAMEFRNCFEDKYDWLAEHFPFIGWQQIVFCGNKKILNADILIDDNAHNFEHFIGQGVLFTAHHNLSETRYPRVGNWSELQDFVTEFITKK